MTTTPNEIFNVYIEEIRSHFPAAKIDFVGKVFSDRQELWVYVLEKARYQAIKDFCERIQMPPEPVVVINVKAWTGQWPGGESESQMRQKREEFIRRAKETQPRKVAHHS